MLYLSLWFKIFKHYAVEAILMIVISLVFFFALFEGKNFDSLNKKLWPGYQDDPYFTVLVEADLSEDQIQKINMTPGVEETTTLDKEELRLRLYNKLKDQNIDFPDEVLDQEMTLLKVFIKESLDSQIYDVVRSQVLAKLEGYSTEASEIKILRKSLRNIKSVQFLKKWSKEIILLLALILWLLSMSFFYWRTYNLIDLVQSYRFQKHLFEKFYLVSMFSIALIVLVFEASWTATLDFKGSLQVLSFIVVFIAFIKAMHLFKAGER